MKFDIYSVLIQEKITALAHEAKDAYETITKAYTNAFSIGQTTIDCFPDTFDYHPSVEISINGTFIYNRLTEIPITENGIFTCFVAELAKYEEAEAENRAWIANNKVMPAKKITTSFDFGLTDAEKEFAGVASVLREVVELCKEKLKEAEKSEDYPGEKHKFVR